MANEVIKGLGFHHTALRVADYEKSKKFYCDGLGMKLYSEWEEPGKTIAMLDIGDGSILEIFSGGNDRAAADPKFVHFAMKVDDTNAAYEAAIKAGAKTIMAPKIVPLDSRPKKMTLNCAFVAGPSGEELELFRIIEIKE